MARCSVSLGSVTASMKAKRALSAIGIGCDVVKISSKEQSRGCIYGIEYPCELTGNVRKVLSDNGIQVLNN